MARDLQTFVRTGEYPRTSQPAPERSRHPRSEGRRRFLLAEDDPSYAGAVAKAVGDALDVDVVVAGSVSQAVSAIRSGHFDAVVADADLGDGMGVEVLQVAREQDGAVPTVLMSGYLQPFIGPAADRLCADASFDKLLQPSVLVETLRRVAAS